MDQKTQSISSVLQSKSEARTSYILLMTIVGPLVVKTWHHASLYVFIKLQKYLLQLSICYTVYRWILKGKSYLKSISLKDLCALGSSNMMWRLGHSKILRWPSFKGSKIEEITNTIRMKTCDATTLLSVNCWSHYKTLLLTNPPAANLDPSVLKARHFWGPTSLRGGNSLIRSFKFDSWPYNSNNLKGIDSIKFQC